MARVDVSNQNPLDAMRIARRVQGNNFNSVVSKCLYSTGVHLSKTVESIVSLHNVRRICCFNYDDLLEDAYNNKGMKFRSLTEGDKLLPEGEEILILHPHGFLPRTSGGNNCANNEIVLSEDDYHALYESPYSWPNTVQLNLLMSFNVLFVGCSLKDPNIRRLLDICKKLRVGYKYFALMKVPDYESKKRWYARLRSFSILKNVEEPLLIDRGVTPIWVDDYSDIPAKLDAIK